MVGPPRGSPPARPGRRPALPADDEAWITALITATRNAGRIGPGAGVATIRLSWWTHIDTVPLGPVLAGVADLPGGVPDPPATRGRWILDVRGHVQPPDVGHAFGRYLTAADDEDAALAVVNDEPALLDPRWRVTVGQLGAAVLAHQQTDEQRQAVTERLALWRRYAHDGLRPRPDEVPAGLRPAFDRVDELDAQDSRALPAVLDLVGLTRPRGPSTLLARALTSLVPILMGAPLRTAADDERLLAVAPSRRGTSRRRSSATVTTSRCRTSSTCCWCACRSATQRPTTSRTSTPGPSPGGTSWGAAAGPTSSSTSRPPPNAAPTWPAATGGSSCWACSRTPSTSPRSAGPSTSAPGCSASSTPPWSCGSGWPAPGSATPPRHSTASTRPGSWRPGASGCSPSSGCSWPSSAGAPPRPPPPSTSPASTTASDGTLVRSP